MDQRERFERELNAVLDVAYRYALRLTRNRETAMDLVQDATVLAFRHFASFNQGSYFKAWFLRIITNKFYKDRSRAPKAVQMPLEDAEDGYLSRKIVESGLYKEAQNPAEAVLDQFDVDAVTAAIDELPDEFRDACALYFLENMPYQEIAEILECPVGTVRSRLHRGRKYLQKALWDVAVNRGIVSGKNNG